MSQQKRLPKKQAHHKKQVSLKPVASPAQFSGQSEFNNLFGMEESATVQTQADRLGDPRLKSAQKQALAAQIGQVQGNKHLQRVIEGLNPQPSMETVQRHWMPGEEEEIQTKPLVQRHTLSQASDEKSVQRHWMPGEEEEVQTKSLLQRQVVPDNNVMRSPVGQPGGRSTAFGKGRLSSPTLNGSSNGHSRQASFGRADNEMTASVVQFWKGGAPPAAKGDGGGPKIAEARVKFDPVTFNPGEIPADSKTTAQAVVKTSPAGRTIKWSITGDQYGSTVDGSGVVTPGNDTQKKDKVSLQVKATDSAQPDAFSTGSLTLWDAKLYQAKKDFPKFVGGTYQYPNFTIGLNGKFDLDYSPAANLAKVTVKVKFTFPDDQDPPKTIFNLFGLIGAAEREARRKRHDQYSDDFIKHITAQWSGRYQFKNVREPQSVWGKLNPTNLKVNVTEVKSGQHFTIEVRAKTKGRASVGGGTAKLFQGSDVPSPAFNPGTAKGELKRVERNTPTPILFGNKSDVIPAADKSKLEFLGTYLSRIHNPKFNINIVGHASATGDKADNQTLSEKRAQAAADVLTAAGAGHHKISPTGVGQTGADKTSQWRKVEITSSIPVGWQNMQDVTAHEFGHMIGLGDEYAGGGSPTATHYDLVKKAFGQDYADQVAKRGDTDYASIMEGGDDVRIQHYVTFWSALCETTMKAALPDPKFGYDDWKFIG